MTSLGGPESDKIEQLERRVAVLESMHPRLSSRYPYTYACDYIRERFGLGSRADASEKMEEISKLLGQNDTKGVAVAFAEAFLALGA